MCGSEQQVMCGSEQQVMGGSEQQVMGGSEQQVMGGSEQQVTGGCQMGHTLPQAKLKQDIPEFQNKIIWSKIIKYKFFKVNSLLVVFFIQFNPIYLNISSIQLLI